MVKVVLFLGLFLEFLSASVSAQEIRMSEKASLKQIYGEVQEAEELMSMNELGMDFRYVLYEAAISADVEENKLELENVRDFAAVYVDDRLVGKLTDENKSISFKTTLGEHRLKLYAENIGRITYGPEILDNSKGLFGKALLNGTVIDNWKMTPLEVRDCQVDELQFSACEETATPGFYRGTFQQEAPGEVHLDISAWGMGEVWVNGQYAGSYWSESTQQSVPVSASALREGKNQIVIFELKSIGTQVVRLSDTPIFK